jgi:hypothetical protein
VTIVVDPDRMDPQHFGNLDPDPHQSDTLDPDPDLHQFLEDGLNVWNISLFEHFFTDLSLYSEARIRIRILIRVKSRIRIRISHQIKLRIRIRIGIRIK